MSTNHSAAVSEQQILDALRRVPTARWGAVLCFLTELEEAERLAAEFDPANPLAHRYTPRQLALLPREQRDAVYAAGAALAEDLYLSGAMNEDAYGKSTPPATDAR